MNIDLKGKRALVTGGSKGIGLAIANQLKESGAQVTVVSRSKPKDELAADFIQANFSNAEESLTTIKEYVGEHPIDILINNTGGPNPGPILSAEWSEFARGLDMHLKMSQGLVQLVTPHMREQQFGRIINIISTSVKMPIPGLGVSNTVRGAMAGWSKTLSFELGKYGITVNNLLPGFIATTRLDAIIQSKSESQNMTIEETADQMKSWVPAGRFGEPQEMAQMAAFLASDLAAYVNGTNIQIDGGRTGAH